MAYRIRCYYHFEIQLDEFDYRYAFNNELIVEPPDVEFEASLRLGYINVEQQILKSQLEASEIETAGYKDFAEWFSKKDLFARVEQPLPRITMQFPVFKEFLQLFEKTLFRDEIGLFELSGKDLFLDPASLAAEPVMGSLTVGDMLKVWRVVNLMAHSLREYLTPLLKTEASLCLRSLIPAFSDGSFRAMLAEILGPAKGDEYIRHLRVGQKKNRDLIYQPLVRAGDFWHVPMNLIASSNFIRNGLALSQVRFHKTKDPLGSLVASTFKEARVTAWHDVSFDFAGKAGDIDCLALLEDTLFIFECKNALHPCGIFELRGTRQHLDKAVTQLERIEGLLQTSVFVEYLSNKLNHDLPLRYPPVSVIVLGHRVLSGYTWKGFEVRSVHELVHFISKGDAKIFGQKIRLREDGPLTAAGMRNYLSGKEFHRRFFSAMTPDLRAWTVSGLKVVEHSYHLEAEALSRAFGVEPPAFIPQPE
jgi:hypothetical protein